MEKVLEFILINLVKGERFFGVLQTPGWLLEWNTALIHCDLIKCPYGLCSPLSKLSKMSKIIEIGVRS
jgi:hypothetical protein